jgi:hypothetical protein
MNWVPETLFYKFDGLMITLEMITIAGELRYDGISTRLVNMEELLSSLEDFVSIRIFYHHDDTGNLNEVPRNVRYPSPRR